LLSTPSFEEIRYFFWFITSGLIHIETVAPALFPIKSLASPSGIYSLLPSWLKSKAVLIIPVELISSVLSPP